MNIMGMDDEFRFYKMNIQYVPICQGKLPTGFMRNFELVFHEIWLNKKALVWSDLPQVFAPKPPNKKDDQICAVCLNPSPESAYVFGGIEGRSRGGKSLTNLDFIPLPLWSGVYNVPYSPPLGRGKKRVEGSNIICSIIFRLYGRLSSGEEGNGTEILGKKIKI